MSRPDAAGVACAGTVARDELFDLLDGYWRTQMLCAAAELGIADVLADGPCDITTLARRTGADVDGPSRLLRALVGFGVVACAADGTYTTTGHGRWLERSRAGGLHARALLIRRLWYPSWAGLAHSVRTGETALDHTFGASLFDYLADVPDPAAVTRRSGTASFIGVTLPLINSFVECQLSRRTRIGGLLRGMLVTRRVPSYYTP